MHTPLMSARRRKRLTLTFRHEALIVNLGEMEIWDGADLALVRDTLFELIVKKNQRSVGVDMSWVKYVPSGFFGMLSDWHDQGIRVVLVAPQPNVREMIWCRQFFQEIDGGAMLLRTPSYDEFLMVEDEEDSMDDEADSEIRYERPSVIAPEPVSLAPIEHEDELDFEDESDTYESREDVCLVG